MTIRPGHLVYGQGDIAIIEPYLPCQFAHQWVTTRSTLVTQIPPDCLRHQRGKTRLLSPIRRGGGTCSRHQNLSQETRQVSSDSTTEEAEQALALKVSRAEAMAGIELRQRSKDREVAAKLLHEAKKGHSCFRTIHLSR